MQNDLINTISELRKYAHECKWNYDLKVIEVVVGIDLIVQISELTQINHFKKIKS